MKCFIFFNLIILVSSSFACPSSKWFRFGSKCFLTHCCLKFQDSVNFCQSLSATTVSILSEEENNFLTTKLAVNKGHWLGIRQVDFNNKTYEWLDGSPYKYSNWNARFQKNCSGAYIFNGKWVDDTQSCDKGGYAFCQIEIYSTIFKMLSQTILVTGNLSKEIKQVKTHIEWTGDRLEDSLIIVQRLLDSDLKNTETRLSKGIEKLEDKMNLMNLSMTFMDSDFVLDLKNKDIQVDNINKELIGLRLVNKRLDDALNAQNALIANMSSDLRQKEIQIKSTEKELVRLSLMITRLENAIHTQNDLIQRIRSTSESAKN